MANVYGFDPVAWSIDGGRHRGELNRVLAYASTGGAEGVVNAGDCKVVQLATPGPGVYIQTGAVLIRNRASNVINQTYVANGRTISTLDVAPTSGSARSDLVVVRVEDPQYAGWPVPPAGTAPDYQYTKPFIIQNVPASTASAVERNLGYAAVALARIDIPANTTNITAAMIKDLRKIANPRRERRVVVFTPSQVHETPAVGVRAQFTSLNAVVSCPEWASEMKIVGTVGQGVYVTAAMSGTLRVEYGYATGPVTSPTFLFTQEASLQTDNVPYRSTVVIGEELAVPVGFRGRDHFVRLSARGGTGSGKFRADTWSNIIIDIEFVQVPD